MIQELLKQSTDDIMGVPVVDHKKFAELIVRECALLCNDPVVVLQHFGVDSKSE